MSKSKTTIRTVAVIIWQAGDMQQEYEDPKTHCVHMMHEHPDPALALPGYRSLIPNDESWPVLQRVTDSIIIPPEVNGTDAANFIRERLGEIFRPERINLEKEGCEYRALWQFEPAWESFSTISEKRTPEGFEARAR